MGYVTNEELGMTNHCRILRCTEDVACKNGMFEKGSIVVQEPHSSTLILLGRREDASGEVVRDVVKNKEGVLENLEEIVPDDSSETVALRSKMDLCKKKECEKAEKEDMKSMHILGGVCTLLLGGMSVAIESPILMQIICFVAATVCAVLFFVERTFEKSVSAEWESAKKAKDELVLEAVKRAEQKARAL